MLAADPDDRNAMISAHLRRLEDQLAATREAVRALRDILDRPAGAPVLEHCSVPAVPSVAVHADVERDACPRGGRARSTNCRTRCGSQGLDATGPPGGLYGFDVFANDRGPATVFIPVTTGVRPVGRVTEFIVPAAELVMTRHRGPHDDVDVAYSALGDYATRHEISVDGPLREYYLTFAWDTDDSSRWETDLCWPIFRSDRGTA